MKLNMQQKQASEFEMGIASVIAVPGSGKTVTMTRRIGNLVKKGVSPENILGLTFTRNAAEAMRNKLKPVLGDQAIRGSLLTIHAFCLRILKDENRRFEILYGKEQLRFIRQIKKKKKINLPSGLLAREISLAKSNLITVSEFRNLYGEDQTMQAIADVYEAYDQEKQQKLLLDFDDLLVESYQLLSQKIIRERYQQAYLHILVDEFQDINPAQLEILKHLVSRNGQSSFWICGDDWQSIYAFTGASLANILKFKEIFPNSKQYILNINYRSTPQILKVCQNLIEHNTNKVEKHLRPNKAGGDDVIVMDCTNEEDEVTQIVNEILEIIERGYQYTDIAILYRANFQSRVLEEILSKYNIPYRIENGTNFFNRFEVKILIDYLRLIQSPDSEDGDEALCSLINVPNRYLGKKFIRELKTYSEAHQLHLYGGLKKMPVKLPYLKKNIRELIGLIDPLIKSASDMTPAEILHLLRDTLDYDQFITEDDVPSPDDLKIANIDQLQFVANKYADIESLLNYTDSFKDDHGNDENGVSLMTIHKAKGLEFPVVFVTGMVKGILPNKNGDVEEERRIAFVALSRAMKLLYVSWFQNYMGKSAQKSSFIPEMFNSVDG
ncbi:MAG: ATP-dependent helicase [Dissulfuribacterales bacterium]